MQIFCPSNHLILDQPTCPVCGWQRPPAVKPGGLLWKPVEFASGIGGPSPDLFAKLAIVNDVAVFPLRIGDLVGISQKEGRVLWQTATTIKMVPQYLAAEGNSILAVMADESPLGESENGSLVRIDPQTGKLQKLWDGYGFTMTDPVFTDSLMIVRTAHPKLVVFNNKVLPSIAWETPLKTFKSFAPVVAGNHVLAWDGEMTKEQMVLKAFNLNDGASLWQASIKNIDSKPVAFGKTFIYRTAKQQVTAVDINNGQELWTQKFIKIYSSLSIGGNDLFFIACDDRDVTSAAHYSLYCLDADSGSLKWKTAFGIRAQEIQWQNDGTLLIGMGDPRIAICSSQDGRILWQYSFGDEKINRVQTHLLVKDGICWLGTYEGKVAAIQIADRSESIPDAEENLKRNNFEEAAVGFALQGNLEKSAEIYLNQLAQPQKALAIYAKLGVISGQANALLQLGDELSAAQLYEKDGQLKIAAKYYEEANQLRKALQIYMQLKLNKEVERLRPQVPYDSVDIESLERDGKYIEAGDAALQAKDLRKAVDLYERAGDPARGKVLDALGHLCAVEPEPWSLNRLVELAKSLGRFDIQADALLKSGKFPEAAEAYYNAARQIEARNPDQKERTLALYEQARQLFEQEGLEEKQTLCANRIIFYRKLPRIQVTGKTERAFREGEFNRIFLEVKNIGFGRADEVIVRIQGGRFEVDSLCLPETIHRLGADTARMIDLSIRPLKDQVGEQVPFVLVWTWKDINQNSYQDKTVVAVDVKKQNESKTGGTPVVINGTYYAGDDYHKEIAGPNVEAGGRIGDSFEINHEGKATISGSALGEISSKNIIKTCPICSLPVEADAQFCTACGYEFK